MLTCGSLFSGIDGFGLGFERAGMRLRWQVEQDPYCLRVLEHHWPDVARFTDVRDVGAHNLEPVDVVCGGFPCQDISVAGKGLGLAGERSGLWAEMFRVVRELRPRYLVVENVAAILGRGLDTVLGDLAAVGFDAEWDCLSASAFGAPHRRDRFWLVAYPGGDVVRQQPGWLSGARGACAALASVDGEAQPLADTDDAAPQVHAGDDIQRGRPAERRRELVDTGARAGGGDGGRDLAPRTPRADARSSGAGDPRTLADASSAGLERQGHGRSASDRAREVDPWAVEPDVGRVAHGVPARVDRLRALGNALVPQIAEWIGTQILEHEGRRAA